MLGSLYTLLTNCMVLTFRTRKIATYHLDRLGAQSVTLLSTLRDPMQDNVNVQLHTNIPF